MRVAAILLLALLGGCAHGASREAAAKPRPIVGWRDVATPADRDRLRTWRESWVAALTRAAAGGQAQKVAAQGVLLQPDAALAGPVPPPGDYACSVTKVGAVAAGMADFVSYPRFTCRITAEKDVLSFAKLDGSQRPVGLLFPNDGSRMIFLGTMMLGDERRALDYGRDPERDMAGAFERIGPQRWRLVLPRPRWESMLDVIELTPKV